MLNRVKKAAARTASQTRAFLVGRDQTGRWVAVETHGRGGGIFKDVKAALHYAAFETGHRPRAVQLVDRPLSLRF